MHLFIILYIESTNDFKHWDSRAENTCEILNCITKTALTYSCNLEVASYELYEDDTVVSKHVGAV
jgi:hypothetical protein